MKNQLRTFPVILPRRISRHTNWRTSDQGRG